MKKVLLFLLAMFIMSLSSIVSADPRHDEERHERSRHEDFRHKNSHHNWSHSAYRQDNWRPVDHRPDRMPFRWHERRDHFSPADYRMERIYHRDWEDRFPGLHPYRWHGEYGRDFWYRGHRVTDAVMFYNDSDELVSVGFWHDGAFILIRDDDRSFENHDSFFLMWRNR